MPLDISDVDNGFIVLFHYNPNPMWIVEIDTLKFIAVNDAAIKHYGYSRQEFLNEITLADIRLPSEWEEMLEQIKNIPHQQTTNKELTHVKKSGAYIYVTITSYMVTYHNKLCRMVIIQDVTQQKIKDRELTEAVERINQTLESITDGFVTLNPKLRITYCNREAQRILSFKGETILNKKLWQIVPPYHEMQIYQMFNDALETGETIKFEEYVIPLDKWLCFSVYPGSDGLAIYFQDITIHKHDEEQLNIKNESLARIAYINSHIVRKPIANIMGIINSLEDNLPCDEYFENPLLLLRKSAAELDDILKEINKNIEQTIIN